MGVFVCSKIDNEKKEQRHWLKAEGNLTKPENYIDGKSIHKKEDVDRAVCRIVSC